MAAADKPISGESGWKQYRRVLGTDVPWYLRNTQTYVQGIRRLRRTSR